MIFRGQRQEQEKRNINHEFKFHFKSQLLDIKIITWLNENEIFQISGYDSWASFLYHFMSANFTQLTKAQNWAVNVLTIYIISFPGDMYHVAHPDFHRFPTKHLSWLETFSGGAMCRTLCHAVILLALKVQHSLSVPLISNDSLPLKIPPFLHGHLHISLQGCLSLLQGCLLFLQWCLFFLQGCLLFLKESLLFLQKYFYLENSHPTWMPGPLFLPCISGDNNFLSISPLSSLHTSLTQDCPVTYLCLCICLLTRMDTTLFIITTTNLMKFPFVASFYTSTNICRLERIEPGDRRGIVSRIRFDIIITWFFYHPIFRSSILDHHQGGLFAFVHCLQAWQCWDCWVPHEPLQCRYTFSSNKVSFILIPHPDISCVLFFSPT